MIKLKVTIGLILLLTGVVVSYSDGVKKDFPVLKGPYLGQKPPGETPELFAPGIITTGMFTRDVAMTPDGKYLFFMSSRTLPKEKLPAKLTYRFLKEIYNKPQNGNSDIYWVDEKIIEDLRPK